MNHKEPQKYLWFDMDGTIADLYGVPNWLEYLIAENPYPYHAAKPIGNFSKLARKLNNLQKLGYKLGIISWGSKNATPSYNSKIEATKKGWLKKHLPSIKWDSILITPYGQDKWQTCGEAGILFDDEEKNRAAWKNRQSYSPIEIFSVLSSLEGAP